MLLQQTSCKVTCLLWHFCWQRRNTKRQKHVNGVTKNNLPKWRHMFNTQAHLAICVSRRKLRRDLAKSQWLNLFCLAQVQTDLGFGHQRYAKEIILKSKPPHCHNSQTWSQLWESFHEALERGHSNESYRLVLSSGTVH